MPRRDPAKAIHMLDLLAEFFDNGRRWLKGDYHDDDGNRSLIGAMTHIRAVTNTQGDGTGYYLRLAQPQHMTAAITFFNDGCRSYGDIALPDLDSRTGFCHREWQKCWRMTKPGR